MDDFILTFPSYVLVSKFNTGPDGGIILDADLTFTAPRDSTGKASLAVFTDHALAKVYQEESKIPVELLELPTPDALLALLTLAAPSFGTTILDPNRKTKMGLVFRTQDLIDALGGS